MHLLILYLCALFSILRFGLVHMCLHIQYVGYEPVNIVHVPPIITKH